jgi:hypothetical protein
MAWDYKAYLSDDSNPFINTLLDGSPPSLRDAAERRPKVDCETDAPLSDVTFNL